MSSKTDDAIKVSTKVSTTSGRGIGKVRKILIGSAGALGALLVVGGVAVLLRENRRFEAPAVDVHASRDPAVIERGRYLVEGPAHCGECHGDVARKGTGPRVPLSGGTEFKLPVGVVRVPNITPDSETGIGRLRDADIARLLRYGVRPDGRAVLPFMPFNNMADDDLVAVISYLRAQPPVRHAVAPHDVNVLGRIVKAFVLTPKGPTGPVPKVVAPAATADYGRYLATSVANCVGCHTRIDMRTGAPIGPAFGGGATIESSTVAGASFVTPNLTPSARWGWIASWPEEVFVARVHMGEQRTGSPMPWGAFRHMSDTDLQAIFRFLHTLPPVDGGPDPSLPESVVLASAR